MVKQWIDISMFHPRGGSFLLRWVCMDAQWSSAAVKHTTQDWKLPLSLPLDAESWMVHFDLSSPFDTSLKLFLTHSQIRSEATLCCCDYFQWQERYGQYNMWHVDMTWVSHVFSRRFTLKQDFEWLAVVQDPLTHLPIESWWKDKKLFYLTQTLLQGLWKHLSVIYEDRQELSFVTNGWLTILQLNFLLYSMVPFSCQFLSFLWGA